MSSSPAGLVRRAVSVVLCLCSAAIALAAAPQAVSAANWQIELNAPFPCPTGTNTCSETSKKIPAANTVTVKNVSCSLRTVVNVVGLSPLSLIRTNASGTTYLQSVVFPPAFVGATATYWNYAVHSQTLFYVQGDSRIAVVAVASETNQILALHCLLSGSIN
jgi:hypothetical protein